jgi:hypothetical protein
MPTGHHANGGLSALPICQPTARTAPTTRRQAIACVPSCVLLASKPCNASHRLLSRLVRPGRRQEWPMALPTPLPNSIACVPLGTFSTPLPMSLVASTNQMASQSILDAIPAIDHQTTRRLGQTPREHEQTTTMTIRSPF